MLQDDNVNSNLDTSQDDIQLADYGFDFGLTPTQPQNIQPQIPQEGAIAPQQPVEPQPPVEDNWQVRASYFQSQYDKLKNQLDSYMPLIQTLESDESAAQRVIAALKGEPVPVQQPAPVLPARPLKPEGYNPEEAVTDPMSPSFKYRVALEEWNEQYADYASYKEKVDAEERQRYEQAARQLAGQERMAAKQREFLGNTFSILTAQKGFSPQEANEFIRDMANDQAITLDNLVGYWKWTRGRQQQMAMPQKPNMPYPAFVGGGRSQQAQPTDPNAQFLQMLRT